MFDNVQNYHLSTPQEIYTGIKTRRRCKVGAMSVSTAIFQTSPNIAYMFGETVSQELGAICRAAAANYVKHFTFHRELG